MTREQREFYKKGYAECLEKIHQKICDKVLADDNDIIDHCTILLELRVELCEEKLALYEESVQNFNSILVK